MSDASQFERLAISQANAGDWISSASSFIASLKADIRSEQSWLGLAVVLAMAGDAMGVVNAVRHRDELFRDGAIYFHKTLMILMDKRAHEQVLALDAALAAGQVLSCVSAYFAGCVRLLRGDEDGAFTHFRIFKADVGRFAEWLPSANDSVFNIAYRQGTLIEDAEYFDQLDVAAKWLEVPEPTWLRPAPPAGPAGVVLAACDSRYLLRFADVMVPSFKTFGGDYRLHLHLVGSDPVARAKLAEIGQGGVGVTVEDDDGSTDKAYYACSRFLVAERLMQVYKTSILPVDMDVVFTQPLAPLGEATRGVDFGCYRYDGYGPCSRYPAVLTYFAPSAAGAVALGKVNQLILAKRDTHHSYSWMLDQAALASAIRWVNRRAPEIRRACLQDLTGTYWTSFMASIEK